LTKDRYTIVENAGYGRECDCRAFDTYAEAIAHRDRVYTADELDIMSPECLHVDIRLDRADGTSTYEL